MVKLPALLMVPLFVKVLVALKIGSALYKAFSEGVRLELICPPERFEILVAAMVSLWPLWPEAVISDP